MDSYLLDEVNFERGPESMNRAESPDLYHLRLESPLDPQVHAQAAAFVPIGAPMVGQKEPAAREVAFSFNDEVKDQPMYWMRNEVQIQSRVSDQLGRKVTLPLMCCDALNHRVVTASDNTEGDNFVVLFDQTKAARKNLLDTDCTDYLWFYPVDQPVFNIKWVRDNIVAAAMGVNGRVSVYQLDEAQLRPIQTYDRLHSDCIRELSISPSCDHFVSGGHDSTISMVDLTSGEQTHRQKFEGTQTVSSIKYAGPDMVHTTISENSTYLQFDNRTNWARPCTLWRTPRPLTDLFAAELINPMEVLLGWGSAHIAYLDLRMSRLVRIEDPYVDAVGQIVYNHNSKAFVTSGYTDFTVWKHTENNNKAKVWSHCISSANPLIGKHDTQHYATFLNDNTIVATTNHGSLGIYDQGFDKRS